METLDLVGKVRDEEKRVSDTDMEENSHKEMTLLEKSEGDSEWFPLPQDSQHQKTDLSWPGQGILQAKEATEKENQECLDKLCGAVKTILECVSENPNRQGLLDTPMRFANAMLFLTKGYGKNAEEIVNAAMFSDESEGMVVVKDIELFSLCEHYLIPFFGKIHVGYVPRGKVIVGLSKLARVVDMCSRRL